MFIVLKVTERKAGGLLYGLYNLLVKPRIYLETRECPGARFALIRAESVGGKLNWGDIERICGAYAGRVFVPEGISAPEGSKIKNPELPAFSGRVLTRTACEIIERSRIPMYRRVLGLIDLEASHSDMLYELLMHYTSVRVVTRNPGKYAAEAARVMDELGAPVSLSENFGCLGECVIAISPSALYTSEEIKLSCPVIAGDSFVCTQKLNVVTALRITPGESFLNACPEGMDPHFFAGAAYEFCGIGRYTYSFPFSGKENPEKASKGITRRDFGNFVADRMTLGSCEVGISDVARAVIECAGMDPDSLLS